MDRAQERGSWWPSCNRDASRTMALVVVTQQSGSDGRRGRRTCGGRCVKRPCAQLQGDQEPAHQARSRRARSSKALPKPFSRGRRRSAFSADPVAAAKIAVEFAEQEQEACHCRRRARSDQMPWTSAGVTALAKLAVARRAARQAGRPDTGARHQAGWRDFRLRPVNWPG